MVTSNDDIVAAMALYDRDRVQSCLKSVDHKPTWEIEDCAEFDCMHYEGNLALDRAMEILQLPQGAKVLDVGAGYGGTARYLLKTYRLAMTSLELQRSIHDVAELVNRRCGLSAEIRSIHGNVLDSKTTRGQLDEGDFHAILSYLCILHIPDRPALFSRFHGLLAASGVVYIEDFAAGRILTPQEHNQLRDIVSCPYLPDRETYVEQAQAAGFAVVESVDLTERWTHFTGARAKAHAGQHCSGPGANLQVFYETVAELFASGAVCGMGLALRKL